MQSRKRTLHWHLLLATDTGAKPKCIAIVPRCVELGAIVRAGYSVASICYKNLLAYYNMQFLGHCELSVTGCLIGPSTVAADG